MQSPIIDEVKKSVGDDGVVLTVDVDGNRELAALPCAVYTYDNPFQGRRAGVACGRSATGQCA